TRGNFGLKLVERWPEQLVRGLIESDGCRFQNTGRGNWSWPRYFVAPPIASAWRSVGPPV
ncbi:MAG: hypothetical protein DLM64_01470, partial [Solirubrobacterales bacterium]